jgi:hypothetical protein
VRVVEIYRRRSFESGENVRLKWLTLGIKVFKGVKMFLLYISAHIS